MAASMVLGGASLARSELRHGVVWYSPAPDAGIQALAARRYAIAIGGKGGPSDADKPVIKALNPGFLWFDYNSVSDNYVTGSPAGPDEHESLLALAARKGWDVEEAYVHYWDDTRVSLGGEILLVPGWGGGSAKAQAQARVPVFYKDQSRRLTNFSTRRAQQLQKELLVSFSFDTPFAGTNLYPDGLALDNAAGIVSAYGTLISGGHIAETPAHATIRSREFQSWYWTDDLGPFLTALKDTLETSASWSKDHKRKLLSINVGSAWDDSYVTRHVADILFLEYQYSPVRNAGRGAVDGAYRRDSLAASAGIASFYSAAPVQSLPRTPGSFTYGEALLGNLAWFLVTRTKTTIFFEQGANSPGVAGWDSLTWRGCIDVADRQLGEAVGAPYTIGHGVDPLGNAYVVKARRYENGLALVRNRGAWSEGIEPATAVAVPLQVPMAPVSPSGAIGIPVRQVVLRNGQGTLLLGSPPGPP